MRRIHGATIPPVDKPARHRLNGNASRKSWGNTEKFYSLVIEHKGTTMKKLFMALLFLGVGLLFSTSLCAQESPQLDARLKAEEEANPLIYNYAPDYHLVKQKEREELELKIARIDSMDLSESRKYKLIRDLYRNRESKKLQKAFLADTRFEEENDD